jgi:hypothetical protein
VRVLLSSTMEKSVAGAVTVRLRFAVLVRLPEVA